MKNILFDIALTLVSGLGHRTIRKIIDDFDSAEELFNSPDDKLLKAGVLPKMIATIRHDNVMERAQRVLDECQSKRVKVLVRGKSAHYPLLLAECCDAPHVLYQFGDINLNEYKLVSVVGTRKVTKDGVANTRKIVEDLTESYDNVAVVSGLAYGVDKESHCAALKNNIPTVAILPGWVLDISPRQHIEIAREIVRHNGALLSDVPFGSAIYKNSFLSRNRLIAGISAATIVVEAPERSGSTSTANMAHSYARSVFALPGRSGDLNTYGTNYLIKSTRAILYQDISDLAVELGWVRKNLCKISENALFELPAIQRNIYSAMPSSEPITLEELCEELDLGIGECTSALLHLECNGMIKSIPGGMYVRMIY